MDATGMGMKGRGAVQGRDGGGTNAPARQTSERPHALTLTGRRKLTVSGVDDVERFDEQEIVMRCGGTLLVVGGEGLSVSRLSVESGDVSIAGRVSSLLYEEAPAGRGGFWGRVFRG